MHMGSHDLHTGVTSTLAELVTDMTLSRLEGADRPESETTEGVGVTGVGVVTSGTLIVGVTSMSRDCECVTTVV